MFLRLYFEFWHRPRSQLLQNGLLFVWRHFFLQKAFLKGHHQSEHSSKNQCHDICSWAWKSAGPSTRQSFAVMCDRWCSGKVLQSLSATSLTWHSDFCNRHPVTKESANDITPCFMSYDDDYDVVSLKNFKLTWIVLFYCRDWLGTRLHCKFYCLDWLNIGCMVRLIEISMTMHRSFRIHFEGGRETVLMSGKGKTDWKDAAQKFVKGIFNNKKNFTVSFLRRKINSRDLEKSYLWKLEVRLSLTSMPFNFATEGGFWE